MFTLSTAVRIGYQTMQVTLKKNNKKLLKKKCEEAISVYNKLYIILKSFLKELLNAFLKLKN